MFFENFVINHNSPTSSSFSSLRTSKALAYRSMVYNLICFFHLQNHEFCPVYQWFSILTMQVKMSRAFEMKSVEHFIPFSPLTFKTCSDKAKDSNFKCSVVNADIQPQSKHYTFQCRKRLLCGPSALCLSHLILTISQWTFSTDRIGNWGAEESVC